MVTVRHALRNALIPVVTYLGPLTAAVLTGSLVVEQIFAIPGMGRYFVSSITSRDYPMVMAVVVIYALIIVIVNLLVDILYLFIDPRIRHAQLVLPRQPLLLSPLHRAAHTFAAAGQLHRLLRDPVVVVCVLYLSSCWWLPCPAVFAPAPYEETNFPDKFAAARHRRG